MEWCEEAATRYIDANQQCSKEITQKVTIEERTLIKLVCIFIGVSSSISAKSWSSNNETFLVH
jgi:hypothetical protein